jgi:hypothetical protein
VASRGASGPERVWIGPAAGLCALIVLGGVYFAVTHPRTKPQASHDLLQVTTDQIRALEFHAQGKSLTLYQNPGQNGATTWTVGSPSGQAADQSLVESFVGQLVTLTPTRTLTTAPTSADLQSYGLAPADTILLIDRTNGLPQLELDVGAQSPVGDYYARVGGNPTVYLLDQSIASEISADPSAWLPPSPSGTAAGTASSSSVPSATSSASAAVGTPATSSAASTG